MFTRCYEPRYGDYKNFDEIKIGAVLDMVQDISIKDSENVGFGLDALNTMNVAWLMQGITIKLLAPVKTNMEIEVSTAVKTLKGATSERGCYIRQNGLIVAETIANWFLWDTQNNKIAKIPTDMRDKFNLYAFREDFLVYEKPKIIENPKRSYLVRICNKDLDTNNHLNNQKSAEILMDALPYDFNFNYAKILYKKPAFLGDELFVCLSKTEKGYYVHLEDIANEVYVLGNFELV